MLSWSPGPPSIIKDMLHPANNINYYYQVGQTSYSGSWSCLEDLVLFFIPRTVAAKLSPENLVKLVVKGQHGLKIID